MTLTLTPLIPNGPPDINENACVLSPNKFNVLSAELGLDSVQQSNEQRVESSDEELTPEKASSGVKGSKWSDIPVEQPKKSRKPVRIRISNDQQITSQQSTNKESKSDSETEINDLGIRAAARWVTYFDEKDEGNDNRLKFSSWKAWKQGSF
ncbi:hypothetical protein C5167_034162 [Papaver somniferum]|uniref:Uncharacterized protein n=1 Tax=Papaver somniferum TaxID=3469 RepID=A0A4Y7KFL7_PAPSO|nr:hypothetical protein C5167_034162 [Papaver somniferum]